MWEWGEIILYICGQECFIFFLNGLQIRHVVCYNCIESSENFYFSKVDQGRTKTLNPNSGHNRLLFICCLEQSSATFLALGTGGERRCFHMSSGQMRTRNSSSVTGRHMRPPLAQMEQMHTCSPAAHTHGNAHLVACYFHGPVLNSSRSSSGPSPEDWFRDHTAC